MILEIIRNNCAAVYFDEADRAIQVNSWKASVFHAEEAQYR